jgi:hypothetical protein
MDQKHIDEIMEKCGYLKCQIDTTGVIMEREKELFLAIKTLRREIDAAEGLKRRQKTNELLRLSGELEALRNLWMRLSALSFSLKESN